MWVALFFLAMGFDTLFGMSPRETVRCGVESHFAEGGSATLSSARIASMLKV